MEPMDYTVAAALPAALLVLMHCSSKRIMNVLITAAVVSHQLLAGSETSGNVQLYHSHACGR